MLRSRKVLFFFLLAVYLNFLKYTLPPPSPTLKLKLLSRLFKISTFVLIDLLLLSRRQDPFSLSLLATWQPDAVVGVPLEGESSPVGEDGFGMTDCSYRNKPIPRCVLGHQWTLSCSPNFLCFPCKEREVRSSFLGILSVMGNQEH